ncbi:MAG: recombination protein RecR [Rhodospirillaceae bacterium TMED8]|nr:recombination protein RecR [Magnetovibrio sp.]OUT53258.1 MAG: recombination protein RecR [Rhodospirillaceae bacterium TMED8]
MTTSAINNLINLLAKLPGLGPRSARRAVLTLIRRREVLLWPLAKALAEVAETVCTCKTCGNVDSCDPCYLCADQGRDQALICVVENVSDLWALERTRAYKGLYHVLGGTLSALDGITPEDLNIPHLVERAADPAVLEVILATSLTVDGQTTAHYITDKLHASCVKISGLAHGVPVGGELDYLDDGTLHAALKQRKPL